MIIRRARRSDIGAIAALDTRDLGASKTEYWQSMLRRSAQDDELCLLVAEVDSEIVGFAVGEIRAWEFDSQPCGWVIVLTVPPRYREQRIGSALFREIRRHFASMGVRKVRTMVARDYHLVLSFFRSQGMTAGPFLQLEKDLSE